MKKYLSIAVSVVFMLTLLFVPMESASAASLTLSASKTEVKIGDKITVSLKVPSGYFASDCRISISDTDVIDGNYDSTVALGDAGGQSSKYSFTVTAKAEGKATISVKCSDVSDENGDPATLKNATLDIIVKNESAQTQKSSDNYLKSLEVSEGTLSPAFDKSTTTYKMTVANSVKSITISAKANHSKAKVSSVSGADSLSVGENTVKIVVKAEDGTTRTYKILVTRESEGSGTTTTNPGTTEPGNANSTDKEYTISGTKYEINLALPDDSALTDFEAGQLFIGDNQYQCMEYRNGDVVLVYASASETNTGMYFVYDHEMDTIYPFVSLESESGYIIVLMPKEGIIPEGYGEVELSIEGKGSVYAYQKQQKKDNYGFTHWFGPETVYAAEPTEDDFYLIYAMNQKGESNWYQYDSVEKTFQRVMLSSNGGTPTSLETENLQHDYENLKLEYKEYKELVMFVFAIGLLVILIMFACMLAIVSTKRKLVRELHGEIDEDEEDYEDEFLEEAEDEVEVEFYEMEEAETASEETEPSNEETESPVQDDEKVEELADDEVEVEFYEMPQIENISKETQKVETKKEKFDTIDLTEISQKLSAQAEEEVKKPEFVRERPGDVILSPMEERKDLMKRLSEGETVEDDDEDFELLDL